MKERSYFFTLFMMCTCLMFAQINETEPNNGSATANPLNEGQIISGTAGNCDATSNSEDYFSITTADDGQLQITTTMSNDGVNNVEITLRLSNVNNTILETFTLTSGGNNAPIIDFIDFPCVGDGPYFIRILSNNGFCNNYDLQYDVFAPAFSEDDEPNNGTTDADTLLLDDWKEGHINFSHYGDALDYYKLGVPENGTLNIYFEGERSEESSSLRLDLLNFQATEQTTWTLGVGGNGMVKDTVLSRTCNGAGIYYIRVEGASCGSSYRLKYDVTTQPVFSNDNEPNNSLAQADTLLFDEWKEGQTDFLTYEAGGDDYYKLGVPENGTLNIYFEGERAEESSNLRLDLTNFQASEQTTWTVDVGGNGMVKDTIVSRTCNGAGIYYIRVEGASCGTSYRLKYNITVPPNFSNDNEPNNSLAQADTMLFDDWKEGHTNFLTYGDGGVDYFKLGVPENGTLNIYFEGERAEESSNLRLDLTNFQASEQTTWTVDVGGNGMVKDTIVSRTCNGAGIYYIRVEGASCGTSYRLKYNITVPPNFSNDNEPNNNIADADTMLFDEWKEGHTNFLTYGDGGVDYFKLGVPENGTLNIYFEGERAEESSNLRLDLTNFQASEQTTWTVDVGGNGMVKDTVVSRTCNGAGIYYIRVEGASCGTSYRLKYDITVPPNFSNDNEPNNSLAQADTMLFDEWKEGHTNFLTYGDGGVDYFKLGVPENGTLNIYFEGERAEESSNLRLDLTNFQASEQTTWTVDVGGNGMVKDTIVSRTCNGAGIYYIRVEGASCGTSYRLKYDVIPSVYPTDVEPNGGTIDANLIAIDTASSGNISFETYGNSIDYYRLDLVNEEILSFLFRAERAGEASNLRIDLTTNFNSQIYTQTMPVGGDGIPELSTFISDAVLAPGTYYLRVEGASCGTSYQIGCQDADNDGVTECNDCDDDDPNNFPGNDEICDGQDNNCNDLVDDDDPETINQPTWYADTDNDGFGDPNNSVDACVQPEGFVDNNNDNCPNDGDKQEPGLCGCGTPDTDSDNDQTPDCNDLCPNDPNKIAPGTCGCGEPEPGTPCDDGDACTENDIIVDTGEGCDCFGTFVDSDNDQVCDADDLCPNDPNKIAPGTCGCGEPEPGTPCDDGDACTENDIIVDTGEGCDCFGTFVDSDNDQVCDADDACPNDPLKTDSAGECGCGNPEPGTLCDDGNANTENDMIDGNCNCVGTIITDCQVDQDCDDNDPCTEDFCIDGICFNEPINCNDNDPCTIDFCIDGVCVNEPINCDDNDPCTIDFCVDGVCVNEPINCDDNDPCTIDFCVDGVCFNEPINCDDGNPCTEDFCIDGVCVNELINCDDNDPCTIDFCLDGVCFNEPINCDDGNPCTEDFCIDGECINEPIVCDDNNPCTEDSCDPQTGECVFSPIICDDEDPCTVDECIDGVCVFTSIVCDDNDPCTEDFCENGVCVFVQINCDDNDPCTEDFCIDGVCVNEPINCDDNNPCTEDFCENGVCVFIEINCDDGDPCTMDFCDENGNCQNIFVDSDDDGTCDAFDVCPNGPEPGTPCDDGDENTFNDIIIENCDCKGVGEGAPPVAECVDINIYVDLNNPDVQHSYFQRIWWIDKSELDGGSTSSSNIPNISVRRHLNFINYDWTTQGACIDGNQNGTINNNDKGKSFRNCLPIQLSDIWKFRKYRLRIQDEFGTDFCNGRVRVLMVPSGGNNSLESIHFTPVGEEIEIARDQEVEKGQEVEKLSDRKISGSRLTEIEIYPNPGSRLLTAEWEGNTKEAVTISLVNVIGQLATTNTFDGEKGHNKVVLDTDRLDSGIYSVIVQMGNERVVKMWIKH